MLGDDAVDDSEGDFDAAGDLAQALLSARRARIAWRLSSSTSGFLSALRTAGSLQYSQP